MRRVSKRDGVERLLAGRLPDDLVHGAIAKLLLGELHPQQGRRLLLKHRRSAEAFMRCVMGIINSDLRNLITSSEAIAVHLPVGEEETGAVTPLEPTDPFGMLQRHDLRRVMFERLEALLPSEPALEPVIRHWAQHFADADRIAGPEFDVNLVHRVRRHARGILRTLALEISQSPTGMELLV